MLNGEFRSIALALVMLSLGSSADAQEALTIDIPGATFTRIIGLNAQGDICGGTLVNGVRLAFAASRGADFTDLTTFAYPGAVFTQCRDINAAGQMVGVYQTDDMKSHGFVTDGPEFISIDVPGATDTRGFGIDPLGQTVGRFTSVDGIVHAFFRSRDGGVLTIDAPGAAATEASGITPQGEITGVYRTADGRFHVDDGHELIERGRVALVPPKQKRGHRFTRLFGHHDGSKRGLGLALDLFVEVSVETPSTITRRVSAVMRRVLLARRNVHRRARHRARVSSHTQR